MLNLSASGCEVRIANQFGDLPIVNIKANSFFKPSFWTLFIPLRGANQLRKQMHVELLKLSTNCTQLQASNSGYFIWVDQPDVIMDAVKIVLKTVDPSRPG
ncbi:hypothetical protein [Nostoc sp.]|uniref:hypothetical protein n=1 Tax=Nostoc sp. TaxID=1180 RepID=UPI002FFCD767